MKTVLITGSNGLLGQKITEQVLADTSVRIIATNRGKNKYPINEGYINDEMDWLEDDKVKAILNKYRPDAIIHTAAITNADTCHEQPQKCHEINVVATANLASLCGAMDIHFIYLSTDFVFDGENGPYREIDQPNPISIY